MRPKAVRKILDERPFAPLCVHMSNGETIEISHPELAIVTDSLLVVPINVSDRVAEHVAHYSLLHIVKIAPRNGARGSRSKKDGRRK